MSTILKIGPLFRGQYNRSSGGNYGWWHTNDGAKTELAICSNGLNYHFDVSHDAVLLNVYVEEEKVPNSLRVSLRTHHDPCTSSISMWVGGSCFPDIPSPWMRDELLGSALVPGCDYWVWIECQDARGNPSTVQLQPKPMIAKGIQDVAGL